MIARSAQSVTNEGHEREERDREPCAERRHVAGVRPAREGGVGDHPGRGLGACAGALHVLPDGVGPVEDGGVR